MLRSVWIMLDSGICIYHADFEKQNSPKNMSNDILSGFLSALFNFSASMGSEMRSVTMTDLILHCVKDESGMLTIATTSPSIGSEEVREKLESIGKLFTSKFGKIPEIIDTDDERLLEFESDLIHSISEKKTTEMDTNLRKLEDIISRALRGNITIDDAVSQIEPLITQKMSKTEKNQIKVFLEELIDLAIHLELDPHTLANLKALKNGVTDWLDKAKIMLEKGW